MSDVITLPLEQEYSEECVSEQVMTDSDIVNLLMGVIRLVKKHGTIMQQSVFMDKLKEVISKETE